MNFFIFEQIVRERKESCSCMMHNYMGCRKWNQFSKNINQITFLVFCRYLQKRWSFWCDDRHYKNRETPHHTKCNWGTLFALIWSLFKLHYGAHSFHCPQGSYSHWLVIIANPLTPSGDLLVTSPYNIHTLFSKGWREYSILSGRSCYLDLTLNSLNQFTRKCVEARREN